MTENTIINSSDPTDGAGLGYYGYPANPVFPVFKEAMLNLTWFKVIDADENIVLTACVKDLSGNPRIALMVSVSNTY